MKGKVLLAAPVHEILSKGLVALGYELVDAVNVEQSVSAQLVKDCVGIVTSTRLLLNRALLESAKKLRWIARMGSGMEIIDSVYAKERGILLMSSPEGNRNAVAEHAVGLLLDVARRISSSFQEVKEGKWLREENRGWELERRTIGIIGFGNTGRTFAEKLKGFNMKVLVYDKYNQDPVPLDCKRCSSLSEIQEEAEIISFHVPLKNDTHYYLDEEFLRKVRNPFVLINTSRGDVINMEVVAAGIASGKITGLAADVWEGEPIKAMSTRQKSLLSTLCAQSNVVVTPHIAGYTFEALYKMSRVLLEKISTVS